MAVTVRGMGVRHHLGSADSTAGEENLHYLVLKKDAVNISTGSIVNLKT